MSPLRLVTIPFSHFCEKARWALDRAGIDYQEDAHVPFFHAPASRRAGGQRSVPVLVTGDAPLTDSTSILRFAAERAQLLPADADARREAWELVERFDRTLGPASRRIVYSYVLAHRPGVVALFQRTGPSWQRALVPWLSPVMVPIMRRSMAIDAAGAARSERSLAAVLGEVEARLADGRRYLVGDRFSVADLTFASLQAPLVQPPAYARLLPEPSTQTDALRERVERARARPSGQFVERLYREERQRVMTPS